jgi:hypothetical protein
MRDARLFRCAHGSALPHDINVIATRGLQAKQEALGMLEAVGGGRERREIQEPGLRAEVVEGTGIRLLRVVPLGKPVD